MHRIQRPDTTKLRPSTNFFTVPVVNSNESLRNFLFNFARWHLKLTSFWLKMRTKKFGYPCLRLTGGSFQKGFNTFQSVKKTNKYLDASFFWLLPESEKEIGHSVRRKTAKVNKIKEEKYRQNDTKEVHILEHIKRWKLSGKSDNQDIY